MSEAQRPKTSGELLEALLRKAAETLQAVDPWTKDGRPAITEALGYLDDLYSRVADHPHPLFPWAETRRHLERIRVQLRLGTPEDVGAAIRDVQALAAELQEAGE